VKAGGLPEKLDAVTTGNAEAGKQNASRGGQTPARICMFISLAPAGPKGGFSGRRFSLAVNRVDHKQYSRRRANARIAAEKLQIPRFQHPQQNRHDRYSHDNLNKQQNPCHCYNQHNQHSLTST
jgi:hypothetical protein